MAELIPPAYDWPSQVRQYAYRDAPGIGFERHSTAEMGAQLGDVIAVIDCVLYRDENGLLVGILNHYDGNNPMEAKDNVNLWVAPDHQRQGIGTALLREAFIRWPEIDLEQQRYTRQGVLFIDGLLKKGHIRTVPE